MNDKLKCKANKPFRPQIAFWSWCYIEAIETLSKIQIQGFGSDEASRVIIKVEEIKSAALVIDMEVTEFKETEACVWNSTLHPLRSPLPGTTFYSYFLKSAQLMSILKTY